ncbi:carboxy-S-adenosyl-L-methionine synthase CmoA [Desulfosediminicola flagellatus]|uniref:carboxy-S-adenosyl-L-methionine synthase CmoA n=1 Tax=Desulfosediminicola flagellatus TaxID=2569541 RepID=UPI001E62522C|nr:carboxy-S-adenosyl-L-methionine synthase CmoA [Desulfosediminicola flagellatus]
MVSKIEHQMAKPSRDKLFEVDTIQEDFVFNERVVEVFDDMLDRSVPYYSEVISSSARLLDTFLHAEDTVYDLGCSTGTTLMEFCRLLPDKGLKFVGIDSSDAMLEKARLKAELYSKQDSISFLKEDITSMHHPNAGGFILNYTLQFIRPLRREAFLRNLYESLRPGGILVLSEKIISHDQRLNREYIDIYHQFKKSKGYSELEIARKREALENVLIPFSIDENRTMLKQIGFTTVETFFQWFNFASFVAVKPS